MGIFNYVDCSLPCPYCNKTVDDFQTKDGDCTLSTVKPWEIKNFYTSCPHCKKWINYVSKRDRFDYSDGYFTCKEFLECIHDAINRTIPVKDLKKSKTFREIKKYLKKNSLSRSTWLDNFTLTED